MHRNTSGYYLFHIFLLPNNSGVARNLNWGVFFFRSALLFPLFSPLSLPWLSTHINGTNGTRIVCVGLPYGYVTTGTASGAGTAERLGGMGGSGGGAPGGGTTYYATASPGDYAAPALGVVSIPRAGGPGGAAPTSPAGAVPRAPADQYVLQRILHAQTGGRGSAMLSLHDFTAAANEPLGSKFHFK